VGIVGCGGGARAHWKGWSTLDGRADVVALADVDAANRAWFKQRASDAREFDSGVTGVVRTSWAMELPADHHAFHVVGETGQLYRVGDKLYCRPNRFARAAEMTFEPVDRFQAEVHHFVECIETGERPIQSHADGIRVLRVTRSAYDFVQSGAGRIQP
jgi:predicted dehydrogenase